jgi:hypothetical protein
MHARTHTRTHAHTHTGWRHRVVRVAGRVAVHGDLLRFDGSADGIIPVPEPRVRIIAMCRLGGLLCSTIPHVAHTNRSGEFQRRAAGLGWVITANICFKLHSLRNYIDAQPQVPNGWLPLRVGGTHPLHTSIPVAPHTFLSHVACVNAPGPTILLFRSHSDRTILRVRIANGRMYSSTRCMRDVGN